jgi:hypothetical protein
LQPSLQQNPFSFGLPCQEIVGQVIPPDLREYVLRIMQAHGGNAIWTETNTIFTFPEGTTVTQMGYVTTEARYVSSQYFGVNLLMSFCRSASVLDSPMDQPQIFEMIPRYRIVFPDRYEAYEICSDERRGNFVSFQEHEFPAELVKKYAKRC